MAEKPKKKRDIVISCLAFVTASGVGTIMANAITATTPRDTNIYGKFCIWLGGAVLSSMVVSAAAKHVSDKVDDGIKTLKEMGNVLKETVNN